MKRIETKKEKWIIKRYLAGMPAKLIAAHLQISIWTVYKKIHKYKKVDKKIQKDLKEFPISKD